MLEWSEEERSFPHKEITEQIIGAAFEVYKHLGYGYLRKSLPTFYAGRAA